MAAPRPPAAPPTDASATPPVGGAAPAGRTDARLPPPLSPRNAPWQSRPTYVATDLGEVPQHLYYRNQYQIDGGRNDRFVAWDLVAAAPTRVTTAVGCGAGALVMGYWDM